MQVLRLEIDFYGAFFGDRHAESGICRDSISGNGQKCGSKKSQRTTKQIGGQSVTGKKGRYTIRGDWHTRRKTSLFSNVFLCYPFGILSVSL